MKIQIIQSLEKLDKNGVLEQCALIIIQQNPV